MSFKIINLKLEAKAQKTIMVEKTKLEDFRNKIGKIEKGYVYHILTQKRVNPYTFILDTIDKLGFAEEISIATYRISEKAVLTLDKLVKSNKIKKLNILVNDNYKTLMKEKSICLDLISKDERINVNVANAHVKVTLIDTCDKKIVITGSGNYSDNPKIEQYSITEDEEIYKFYKEQLWADQQFTQLK